MGSYLELISEEPSRLHCELALLLRAHECVVGKGFISGRGDNDGGGGCGYEMPAVASREMCWVFRVRAEVLRSFACKVLDVKGCSECTPTKTCNQSTYDELH